MKFHHSFIFLLLAKIGSAEYCGCDSCTQEIWDSYAIDASGSYTCGARISWLQSARGYDLTGACAKVADEFPEGPCGWACDPTTCDRPAAAPTPPPASRATAYCGCDSCTQEVWDSPATDGSGSYTCGARISWLQADRGYDEMGACSKVAEEFPDGPCGPACDPTGCGAGTTFPTIISSPVAAPSPKPTVARAPALTDAFMQLKVMSYNTEYTGYWDGRFSNFAAHIVNVGADLVGLQECQDPPGIAAATGYALLLASGGGNTILYKGDRLQAIKSGRFNIPSDEYAQRTISWGEFRILRGVGEGREFWFFNTHLPHRHGQASDPNTHAVIANMLLQSREELGAGDSPTVVTGDCNPFASASASRGSFESNLAAGGIALVHVATGSTGGYAGLDKIFASQEHLISSGAGDVGTGTSDHPAIAADITLKADSSSTPAPPTPVTTTARPSRASSYCGCFTCTGVEWNTPATDGSGTYTCGARITYLQTAQGGSKSEYDSCKQVSEEFSADQCGPSCNPSLCNALRLGDPDPENLIWSDEFDVDGIPDPAKWTYDLGDGCDIGLCNWGNGEVAYYKSSGNVAVSNGVLRITAKKEDGYSLPYTSTRMVTRGLHSFKYGRVQFRANLVRCKAIGTWPALWMLPEYNVYGRWPNSGEIDVMETVGHQPDRFFGTVHTANFNGMFGTQKGSSVSTSKDNWHIFEINWEQDLIQFAIDGQIYFEYPRVGSADWPFDQEFHLIMNIAVGGTWGGQQGIDIASFEGTGQVMEIDWVRVYAASDPVVVVPTPHPTAAPSPGQAAEEPTDFPADMPTSNPLTPHPTTAPSPGQAVKEPTDFPTDLPTTDSPTDLPTRDFPTDLPTSNSVRTNFPTDFPTHFPTSDDS